MTPRTKTLALLTTLLVLVLGVTLGMLRDAGGAVRAGGLDAGVRPTRAGGALAGGARDGAPGAPDPRASSAAERATVVVPAAAPETAAAAWEEGFDATALYGTVLDDGARPIPGARCVLWKSGARSYADYGAPLAECATNEDGRFRFPELAELEEFRIYVEAAGFLPELATRHTGVDEEITLSPSASFRGRVLDAATKAPLAGVRVSISTVLLGEDGALESDVASTTDADGRYSIPFARVDRMQRVAILPPGGMSVTREFQVNPRQPDGYDVELARSVPITVRLYDLETRAALAEQELEIARGVTVLTDAHGLARLAAPGSDDLEEGRIHFSLRPEGRCHTTRIFTLPAGGPSEPIDLPLFRGARVTGTVTDVEGRPVAGASIGTRARMRALQGYDLPPGTSIRAGYVRIETDASGAFEVTGLLPGEHELRVSANHTEHPPALSDPFYLPTARAEKHVELELGAGATVEGTVTLNGEPIHARVRWRGSDSSGTGGSNDSGLYRMHGVPPGKVTLSAGAGVAGWRNDDHTEEIVVKEGELNVHDIRIAKNRATISGIVRDAGGAALAGVRVAGWANDEGRGVWHNADDKTDAEGRFELAVDDTPGVSWSLWASEGERNASRSEVPVGATNVELILPRTGRLRIEVVDEVTRKNVQRFNLYWRERGTKDGFRSVSQGGRELSPGPDGVYEAELPVGTLDLRVSARSQGYVPADLPNVVVVEGALAPAAIVPLAKGVTVEITFTGLPSDAGRPRYTFVTDEQRAELEGQRWSDYSGREIHGPQRAQPDAQGKVTLKAMPPGRYSIWELPRGHVLDPARFEVSPVDVHVVDLRWSLDPTAEEGPSPEAQSFVYEVY